MLTGPEADAAVEVSVATSLTRMTPFDTLAIEVSIHNPTDRVMGIGDGTIIYAIENEAGVNVTPFSFVTVGPVVFLEPGETRVSSFTWDWPIASPGPYRVYGALGQQLRVRSEPVPLTIVIPRTGLRRPFPASQPGFE